MEEEEEGEEEEVAAGVGWGCEGVGSESVNLQDGGGGERAEDIWRHLNTKGLLRKLR